MKKRECIMKEEKIAGKIAWYRTMARMIQIIMMMKCWKKVGMKTKMRSLGIWIR